VPAILGIDTAWTRHEPSGVALVSDASGAWECAGLAPSYGAFIDLAGGLPVDWVKAPTGASVDVIRLLDASRRLCGGRVDVIAVDMPLSTTPIVGRRAADNQVSKEFWKQHCGTHSPNAERPGPIADQLRADFDAAGFPLATSTVVSKRAPALIEVYPHPALLTLLKVDDRLPYKAARLRRYWPKLSPVERRANLLVQWRDILTALRGQIGGIHLDLPDPELTRAGELKRYEDALDALICCWVGVEYLLGRANPFGDANGAIWIPQS